MTREAIYLMYRFFWIRIPTFFNCMRSGLSYDSSWAIKGRIFVLKRHWYERIFASHDGGTLIIGKGFICNNKITSNSIGLIQPCVFDIKVDNSQIIIGDNVGVSGSTINAATSIIVEDNVRIGSGCIITDTDSHPLKYEDRLAENNKQTNTAPILIKEGAFIGARSIILKGVTIGRHAIVGAGSVVSRDVPDNAIVAGNPARVINYID